MAKAQIMHRCDANYYLKLQLHSFLVSKPHFQHVLDHTKVVQLKKLWTKSSVEKEMSIYKGHSSFY